SSRSPRRITPSCVAVGIDSDHRAAAAFLAISRRFFGESASARANPPAAFPLLMSLFSQSSAMQAPRSVHEELLAFCDMQAFLSKLAVVLALARPRRRRNGRGKITPATRFQAALLSRPALRRRTHSVERRRGAKYVRLAEIADQKYGRVERST